MFLISFKGTVSEISIDRECNNGDARFKTVPLKALSDQLALDINVYNF
jgi:superfamily II RNA helicase